MKRINHFITIIFLLISIVVHAQQRQPKLQGSSSEFVNKFESSAALTKDVSIKLTDYGSVTLRVEHKKDVNGSKSYFGKVKNENSLFNLRTLPNERLDGRIVLKDKRKAFKLYADEQHNVYTKEVDINEVICIDYNKQEASVSQSSNYYQAAVPADVSLYELQSYPQATAVVLLDFDGQYVPAGSWGSAINALPGNFSPDGIYQTWQKISEDFRPFKLNITTSEAVYQAAPTNKRMRAIFTPTRDAMPGAGGVAFVGSFTWGNETPCWVFNEGSQSGGDSGSHEIGHTLNLIHDGWDDGTTRLEYYGGTDNIWAPIMGVPQYAQDLVQWSKGEYNFANNLQDDIAIIAGASNGFGFRDDLVGNTISAAAPIVVSNIGVVSADNNSGVLENASDIDVFSFYTTGGVVNLNVIPFTPFTNLNVQLTVKDINNNVIVVINPSGYNALLNQSLTTGTYYMFIDGVGDGNASTTGYSDYAAIGSYTIEGTIPLNVVPVDGVSVTPSVTSTMVNTTQMLTATVSPSNATNKNVTWSSSNTTVAMVSNTGVVTGKGDGTAVITVTTADGGKTASCSITIYSIPVTGVSISPSSVSIEVNATQQLTAFVAPMNATYKNVTWVSNNPAIATVSNTGLVTGKAAGTASITVTTQDGNKTYTSSVTVNAVPVTGVSVSPASASILVNGTQQLTATIAPSNATNKTVAWTSSNTVVATVGSTGLVTGKGAGSAVITATTQDGSKTATSTITVSTVAVTGVSLNPASASISVNATKQLTATITPSNATNKTVTWISSNTTVATVSTAGLVTGKVAGTATITVTTQDGTKTSTSAITVIIPVTGVSVSPASATINVNTTQQLTATVSPSNATTKTVTWSTSNATIATVSSTGLVTGKAAGTATITVTTQSGGKTATAGIIVVTPVTWGPSTRYEAENGFNSCVSVSTSNGGYSGSGYVTGLTNTCSETKFDKNISTLTTTKMDIHYANGTSSNITNLALYIGSNQKIQDLVLSPTGSWSTWGTVTLTFNHDPSWGSNIRIVGTASVTTSANIDYSELAVSTSGRAITAQTEKDQYLEKTGGISVHPNPANDFMTVTFYAEAEDNASLHLTTTMSQLISSKFHHVVKGMNEVVFDVKGLDAGLYLLQLRSSSRKEVKKVIIGN